MNQQEKRLWLIRQLLAENSRYRDIRIPSGEPDQKDLLRALMNVRPPEPLSEEVLAVQDEYLSEENLKSGVTNPAELKPCRLSPRAAYHHTMLSEVSPCISRSSGSFQSGRNRSFLFMK